VSYTSQPRDRSQQSLTLNELTRSLEQGRAIVTLLREANSISAQGDCRAADDLMKAATTLAEDLLDQREGYMRRMRAGATTIVASLAAAFALR
jgi:hypothetical protein